MKMEIRARPVYDRTCRMLLESNSFRKAGTLYLVFKEHLALGKL